MNVCLKVDKLKKDFRSHWTYRKTGGVRNVSFEVAEGECFALLGANGAGKTTTIKCLLGLLHPSGGEIKVFGKPADGVSHRASIGFLPEQPYFYQHLTVRETLLFYASLFDMARKKKIEVVEELLMKLKLDHKAKSPVRTLSKGQQQRLGLAQALVNDPLLIILDEPFSGLDPIARVEIRNLLQELKTAGKTIILSSHVLHDIEQLCDKAVILKDGEVAMTLDLASAMLGEKDCYRVELSKKSAKGTNVSIQCEEMRQFVEEFGIEPISILEHSHKTIVEIAGYEHASTITHMAVHKQYKLEGFSRVIKNLEDFFIEAMAKV